MTSLSLAERFWSKVNKTDSCWLWTAALYNGYGRFNTQIKGVTQLAHRLAYEELVGPIPDGLQLDHLCRNRACVNPAHLEPVTQRENGRRGISPPAQNTRKAYCPEGHEYKRRDSNGWRRCNECHAAYMRGWRARALDAS